MFRVLSGLVWRKKILANGMKAYVKVGDVDELPDEHVADEMNRGSHKDDAARKGWEVLRVPINTRRP